MRALHIVFCFRLWVKAFDFFPWSFRNFKENKNNFIQSIKSKLVIFLYTIVKLHSLSIFCQKENCTTCFYFFSFLLGCCHLSAPCGCSKWPGMFQAVGADVRLGLPPTGKVKSFPVLKDFSSLTAVSAVRSPPPTSAPLVHSVLKKKQKTWWITLRELPRASKLTIVFLLLRPKHHLQLRSQ